MGARPPRPLSLPAGALARLTRSAADAAPREACGVLVGTGDRVEGVVDVPNVAAGLRRFELDPDALFAALVDAEAVGQRVIGTFHSHPRAPGIPSPVDVEGWVPGWVSVVVGADGRPRAWDLVAGTPQERPLVERPALPSRRCD